MPRIRWTAENAFRDGQAGIKAPPAPGAGREFDVEDETARRLLDAYPEKWERVDDQADAEAEADDDESDADDDAESESGVGPDADDSEGPDDSESEPEPESESESESKSEIASDESEFDAESFIDDHWRSVADAISDGEVDAHLDAIQDAEYGRDGDPRSSVIEALDEREETPDEGEDTEA